MARPPAHDASSHLLCNAVRQAYDQTITAFNGGLLTLAGAGVRLLIEGICKEKNVNDGPLFDANGIQRVDKRKNNRPMRGDNLEGKINGMVEQDFISKTQSEHLHQIRFLGNDAAHQLDVPDVDVVNDAIDIVEHLIGQVYEQPEKANSRTQPRRSERSN